MVGEQVLSGVPGSLHLWTKVAQTTWGGTVEVCAVESGAVVQAAELPEVTGLADPLDVGFEVESDFLSDVGAAAVSDFLSEVVELPESEVEGVASVEPFFESDPLSPLSPLDSEDPGAPARESVR